MSFELTRLAQDSMADSNITEMQVKDCIENPDDQSNLGPYSIKKKIQENGSAILLYTDSQSNTPKVLPVYRIYQDFIESNITEVTPAQMLVEFMNNYGIEMNTPYGRGKCIIDYDKKRFFGGTLNLDLYRSALKKHS